MAAPSPDPHVIGDFRIEKRLGAGGMGVVYLARQISLGRPVALKVLGASLTRPADVARFRREAQAAARLKHPGVAGVYYVGQEGGICYMAMEYIDGASLRQVISRLSETDSTEATIDSVVLTAEPEGALQRVRFDEETEPFEAPDAEQIKEGESVTPQALKIVATRGYMQRCCEIVRDAAIALEHAAARGIVHRDIKPENLMVDREGKSHIIDFGIARFFEDRTLTHTGQLVGTPMYMSPEQVTGSIELDHRTDVYSLGVILYEILTLRPPITAPTREAVLRRIATKSVPPVTWQNPSVPRDLESVVHKTISRDPDERYQTGGEFAADLQRYLHGKPVLAKPYRYKFDPQEIEAARPRWLVFAAMFCFFVGLFGMLNFVLTTLAVATGDESLDLRWLAFSLGWLLVVSGILSTGFGILSGRQWARIACVLICVLFAAGITAGTWFALRDSVDQPLPTRAVPLGVFSLVWLSAGSIIWGLFTRRTADWFKHARRLRAEYRAERKRR